MTDQVTALIAEAPTGISLARASHLNTARVPVLPVFEDVLPERGLRPGSTVQITGTGATSLALALVARPSVESWTACVGMPELGLRSGAELGVDLDRLVVVGDPREQWTDVLAALVDAFDVVLAHRRVFRATRSARKIAGRVRERDAVLVVVGDHKESDITIEGTSAVWHGIGGGHGHLAARTIDVVVSGRRAAARPRHTKMWLPDVEGEVRPVNDASVTDLRTRTA